MLGDRPSPPELTDVPEAEVAERRGFSLVWLIPAVAAAIALWLGYATLQRRPRDHHHLRERRGARGRQDQGQVQGRRGRPGRAGRDQRRPFAHRRDRPDGQGRRALHERRHRVLDRPAAHRRGRRLRPRHAALGRLHRGRSRQRRRRPRASRASRSRRRSAPTSPAGASSCTPRSSARCRAARRSTTATSRSGRCSATSSPTTTRACWSTSSSTRRTTGWCATTAGSGTRAGSTSRSAPTASRSRRVAAGAPRRRRRLRHPGDRPAGRAGGRRSRVPAVRELPRGDRSALHREGPLPGLLRRLGARPARRRAGRVPRHADRLGDRRRLEIDPEQEAVRIPVTIDIEPQRISMSGDAARAPSPTR